MDHGDNRHDELLELAYNAMNELKDHHGLEEYRPEDVVKQPVRIDHYTHVEWKDEDDIWRRIEAKFDEESHLLTVGYNAGKLYQIEGREDSLELSIEEEMGEFENEEDGIKHAVKQAYKEAREIDEEDLERGSTRLVSFIDE